MQLAIKTKRLLILNIFVVIFILLSYCILVQSRNNKSYKQRIEKLNEINEDYSKNFKFQNYIEGQKLNCNLKFYSVREDKYLSYNDFLLNYKCVFHLTEIGCNECYIQEFSIMREVFENNTDLKKIAIITNAKEKGFVTRLIKDYAYNFDVYQISSSFFEHEIKNEAPFFVQFNENGNCYNAHKSSKIVAELTYLYLQNLKNKYGDK